MTQNRDKRKRSEGGAAGGGKKNKYFQSNAKATIPVGSRGVLISCVGGKEQYAANDSIRILTQYYEQLKSNSEPAAPSNPEGAIDISNAIADEVAELQNPKGKLFSYHKVNVFGLIYITLNSPDLHPTPSEIVTAAARDVQQSKQCLSKVCMRFMPIEGVCYAGLEDISKLAKKMLPEHFPAGADAETVTFGVLYEHRASDHLKRMDVINTIVDCISQPPHKVDLTNPKKTVLVEVMKATAAISVIDDYKTLGKLNLRELSLIGDEDDGADKKDSKPDKSPSDKQPSTVPHVTASTTDASEAAVDSTKPDAEQQQNTELKVDNLA